MVLGVAMCVAMAFTGCKSGENAHKKAYREARPQEQNTTTNNGDNTAQQDAVVAPVEAQPATRAPIVDNYDNELVHHEIVSVISGSGSKAYSVVIGSFGVKSSVEGLQQHLKNVGYDAQAACNAGDNMYHVVAFTYDSKASAVQSCSQPRATYANVWLFSR